MNGIWQKTNKIYDLCDGDYTYLKSKWNTIFKKDIIRLLKNKKVVSDNFWYLENIHNEILDDSLLDYDFNSGVNGITKKLYDVDKSFMDVYHSFLKDLHSLI